MIELRNAQGTRVWGRIDDQDDGFDYSYDSDRPRAAKPGRPAAAAAPATSAPKRPRGRPRKHPLAVPVPAVAPMADGASS